MRVDFVSRGLSSAGVVLTLPSRVPCPSSHNTMVFFRLYLYRLPGFPPSVVARRMLYFTASAQRALSTCFGELETSPPPTHHSPLDRELVLLIGRSTLPPTNDKLPMSRRSGIGMECWAVYNWNDPSSIIVDANVTALGQIISAATSTLSLF